MNIKAAVAIGALFVAAAAMQATAQDLRWRTINVIVPVAAGGSSDTYARAILPVMADCLGTNVAVRNVPGDGHLLGIGQTSRPIPTATPSPSSICRRFRSPSSHAATAPKSTFAT
jgi:tripartite-type tricarboxylate transporter receptor subunit TctC